MQFGSHALIAGFLDKYQTLSYKKKCKNNKRWWFFKRFAVSYNYKAVKKIVKIEIAGVKQAARRRDKGMKPDSQPTKRTCNQPTN